MWLWKGCEVGAEALCQPVQDVFLNLDKHNRVHSSIHALAVTILKQWWWQRGASGRRLKRKGFNANIDMRAR